MSSRNRALRVSAAAVLVSAALVGCFPDTGATNRAGDDRTSGCASVLDDALAEQRSSATDSMRLNWLLDDLSSRCPAEYEYFVDTVAAPLRGIELDTGQSDAPAGTVEWSRAAEHVGRKTTVCGPLINDGTSRDDVFLNLGRGYPDQDRFTIVVWDVGAVEEIPRGVTLCIEGIVTLYEGVAQIETKDPGDVKIYD